MILHNIHLVSLNTAGSQGEALIRPESGGGDALKQGKLREGGRWNLATPPPPQASSCSTSSSNSRQEMQMPIVLITLFSHRIHHLAQIL